MLEQVTGKFAGHCACTAGDPLSLQPPLPPDDVPLYVPCPLTICSDPVKFSTYCASVGTAPSARNMVVTTRRRTAFGACIAPLFFDCIVVVDLVGLPFSDERETAPTRYAAAAAPVVQPPLSDAQAMAVSVPSVVALGSHTDNGKSKRKTGKKKVVRNH